MKKLTLEPHRTTIRIRYEETDRMGVVYYANYFVWFEIARTEYFRKRNLSYRELEEKKGLYLMVVDAYCDYKAPATYDDLVFAETTMESIKNTSLQFVYKIFRDSALLATGRTTHVFTNKSGKPIKIPEEIKEVLLSL